jgi:hypothetical protein
MYHYYFLRDKNFILFYLLVSVSFIKINNKKITNKISLVIHLFFFVILKITLLIINYCFIFLYFRIKII